MSCADCKKPDAPRVTLVDGGERCSWCEDWRHECEARTVLAMPTLARRRAFLYGERDERGKIQGGVLKQRGEAAVKRLEEKMTEVYYKK